jgi:hypothetical protein
VPRRKAEPATAEPQTPTPAQPATETVTQATVEAPTEKETKNITVKGEQLEGQVLLAKTKEFTGKPIDEVAKACGFYKEVTSRETGETKTTVFTQDFMAAMIKAQTGIEFAAPVRAYSRRTNRAPVVTVGGNGNIVIGNRYSSVAGFLAATKVKVEAVEGKITVTAYEGGEDDDLEDGEDETEQDELDL